MDKFETQSGGHVTEGHEESDLSIRGIVLFGVFLAIGGVISFALMYFMIGRLEDWEVKHEAKLTPVQEQLQKQREAPPEGLGKEVPTAEGEVKPAPDWYGRGEMEKHLSRTIATPRLQYNDEYDMQLFRTSEQEWLKSAGKTSDGGVHIAIDHAMEILAKEGLPQVSGRFQAPNVGAPSSAYPTGAADTGQPRATGGTSR